MEHRTNRDRRSNKLGVLLGGLAMSVGWGFRGDYGHEAGAMVPGALIGLAVCLASGRKDWWRRGALMGLCGAIGWAFGGQMSYGRVIGYTASSSLLDVSYGYASLFLIGGLWAGIGSGFLAMSVTEHRSYLERLTVPLITLFVIWLALDVTGATDRLAERWYLNDTDWVAALSALVLALVLIVTLPQARSACVLIAVLAGSWWVGYLVLTVALGLHMTPPRSDNWSGCLGLFGGLIVYLIHRRNRTAVTLAAWGFVFGGLGFALGDFVQMLGRAQWGPIGRYEALQGLDYWKWMEQLFGLIMGLGVSGLFLRWARSESTPPAEDSNRRDMNLLAWVFLLVIMMWTNLQKNVETWSRNGSIPAELMGVDTRYWFLFVGVLLGGFAIVAIACGRKGRLPLAPSTHVGRAQLLFLLILWVAVVGAFLKALPRMSSPGVLFVHMTFWITAAVCSLLVVCQTTAPRPESDDRIETLSPPLRLSKKYGLTWLLIPPLILLLAWLTLRSHSQPLPGGHLRFPNTTNASVP